MGYLKRIAGAIIILSAPASPALAQDEDIYDAYIGAFYRMCLTNDFRAELMIALAAGQGWKEVPPAMVRALERGTWKDLLRGWVVDVPEQAPEFVGLAGVTPDGEFPRYEFCGAYFPDLDGPYMVEAVKKDAEATVVRQDTQADGGVAVTLSVPDLPSAVVDIMFYPGDPHQGLMATVMFLGAAR